MIFFNYCKDFISKINQQSSNVTSVTFFSSIFFLIFVFLYANLVYVQFSFFEICKVFISFLLLFCALILIFNSSILKQKPKIAFNAKNIFWSFSVFLFLILILYSPSAQFHKYYHDFPLLDVETGFGWYQDSVFHVSIINSFVNFNYPSIGQHDAPVILYHTLSHFVDSLIIRFAGVDAWDSYGFFYFFKRSFLLLLILILITNACKRLPFILYIISILIMTPLVVGSWHSVGSHGLWFTSFLIISSSSFLFEIFNEKKLSFKHYSLIFVILLFISFGKISSGLACTLLIGFFLLLKNHRDYRVYLLGFVMLAFFYIYSLFYVASASGFVFAGFSFISKMLLLEKDVYFEQLKFIYIVSSLTFIVGCFSNSKAIYVALSGLLSALVLSIVFALQPELRGNADHAYYMIYALSYVLLIFSFQAIASSMENYTALVGAEKNKFIRYCVYISILFMICIDEYSAKFGVRTISNNSVGAVFNNINNHPFENLTKQLNLKEDITVEHIISSKQLPKLPTYNRPLLNFKLQLRTFMKLNDLIIENSLMFVPKEIFESDFDQFNGQKWVRGMMIYAITEVPLIHGLYLLRKDFGYADYDDSAKWLSRALFDKEESCKFEKDIIIVETLTPPKFSLIRCN